MQLPEQEYVAAEKITPYERNPRKITREAVDAVRRSIKKYGMVQPIVVDHNYVIVAGHTRYAAMQELGHNHVPVYRLPEDTPPEKVAEFRLVDNRVGEMAKWDNAALITELREMNEEIVDSFFPDVDLQIDTTTGIEDVSAEDIESAMRDITTVPPSPGENEPMVPITCPSCSYTFEVTERSFMGYVEY